jgi:hypothetical protein
VTRPALRLAAAAPAPIIQAPPPVYLLSGSVNWRTPLSLFEAQVRRWGPFWVDLAASEENTLAPYFFDEARDGLAQKTWAPTAEVAQLHGWGAFGNYPYTRGEEPCLQPVERCKKRRCTDPTSSGYRGHHITRRVAPLGEWVARARNEALAWGGPVVSLVPERADTEWWKKAVRQQPVDAGRWLGGLCCPNGGPAAPFFPAEYPAAEWREYRWENLTVDVVIVEGRVHFEGQGEDDAGATFPSAVVTFYRPGVRR